jgi:membrane protein YdbS with pleckstrin-like domain
MAAPAPPPPLVTTEGEFRLHPSAQRLWRWQGVALVLAACVPPSLLLRGSEYWLALIALVAVLVVRLTFGYLRRYGDGFHCRLGRDGLLVERGVWWRSETFVPRARVQHTDIGQGPLGRHFGIATLKVFTAGSHVGELDIRGLAHADAVTLRDNLLGRDGRNTL